VKCHTTGTEKLDEKVGIPSLSAGMANGAWLIPTGGEPHAPGCECGWCAWVRELVLYPSAEHTDVLMAMWLAELAARKGGRRPGITFLSWDDEGECEMTRIDL
jgi:hypothetical protein